MEYPVIVENNNGNYRALIPSLADLSAEGQSPDEALQKVQAAAETYLSAVKLTTIKVNLPQERALQPGSPPALLQALAAFAGDEEALREHFEEIERERQRQREEAARQDAE